MPQQEADLDILTIIGGDDDEVNDDDDDRLLS